jgi:hypothetical protein
MSKLSLRPSSPSQIHPLLVISTRHCAALQGSQIRKQCLTLFERWPTIEVHAVRAGGRWNDTRGRIRLHALEELDVVIDDLLESGCAVVVEIRSGLADPAKSGHIEFVPIILGGQYAGSPDEAGEQGAAGIRAGASDCAAVRQSDLVSAGVAS